MRLSQLLLARVAIASLTAAAPASADPIGKDLVMYMQMGGNPGDGSTLARQTGAKEASEVAGRRSQAAVFRLGARENDRAVQGSDGRQTQLHRNHGPSGIDCVPRSRQAGRQRGHRGHRRQRSANRIAERVRTKRLRLCGRRPLCWRRADRQGDVGRWPEARRRGGGLGHLQPGRARHFRERSGRDAREGGPRSGPAGNPR